MYISKEKEASNKKSFNTAIACCLIVLVAMGLVHYLFRPAGYFGKMGNPGFRDIYHGGAISAADSSLIWVTIRAENFYEFSEDGGNNWQSWPCKKSNKNDIPYREQGNSVDGLGRAFGMGFLVPVDEEVCWYEDVLMNTDGSPANGSYTRAGSVEREAFLRVSPVSRDTAWVVTNDTNEDRLSIYRTLDCGTNWERRELPSGCEGNKLLALSDFACWVDVYRTTDGGITWEVPDQTLTLKEFTESSADELLLGHGYLFNGYCGLKRIDSRIIESWGWNKEAFNVAIAVTRQKDIVLVKQDKSTDLFYSSIDRGLTWRKIDDQAFVYDSLDEYLDSSGLLEEGLIPDEICIASKDAYFLGRPSKFIMNLDNYENGQGEQFFNEKKVGLIFTHDGGVSWEYAPIHKYPTWIDSVSLAGLLLSAAALLVLILLRMRKRRSGLTQASTLLEGNKDNG